MDWKFLVVGVMAMASVCVAAEPMRVYIGNYGGNRSKGVLLYKFDPTTGSLTADGLAAETGNPGFMAIHPNHRFMYVLGDMAGADGKKVGAVKAYAIEAATGKLNFLNAQPTGGAGACHVSIDPSGKVALVANYSGGNVESIPVRDDGTLGEPASFFQHAGKGPNPKRQEKAHAHSFNASPDSRFALAVDLGIDKIMVYRLDAATGKLTPSEPPSVAVAAGVGPRHLAFHPSGKFVYVINELVGSICAFSYETCSGVLTPIQSASTLPEGFTANNTSAEVVVHPSGKFLYGSNRGHDSIAVFTIDPETGLLKSRGQTPVGGKHPRNFNVDPTGQWLIAANMESDSLTVFRIDPATGDLTLTATLKDVPAPVCVKFLAE